jgi:hypothetical protein
MADLFAPQVDEAERRAAAATAARAQQPPPAPAATFDLQGAKGCGNCAGWTQRPGSDVLGACAPRRWPLVSFAALCPDHSPRS